MLRLGDDTDSHPDTEEDEGRWLGSSTSTALRAEYEFEYEVGAAGWDLATGDW